MTSILAAERDTYGDIWSAVPSYGQNSPGEGVLPIFLDIVGEQRGFILDAGTGSGKGALALDRAGFTVACCDLTDVGLVQEARRFPFIPATLWQFMPDPGAWDWVYCTDVLEHVPPQFTMLVVDRLLRAAMRGVFISVSLVPDTFGVWVGKPLHQTVQPFLWWKDSLSELGTVTDARDLIASATFYVEPR